MEFGKATMEGTVQGTCSGCGQQRELTHTVAEIVRNPEIRDGMGRPVISLGKGFLICAACSDGPIWHD